MYGKLETKILVALSWTFRNDQEFCTMQYRNQKLIEIPLFNF